jgi:hypothetical protein
MTALNIATDIPSNINTLEKLVAWATSCLHRLNTDVSVSEGVDYVQRAAQANPYYVAQSNIHRLISRTSIELDPDLFVGGRKLWTYAKEINTTKVLTDDMKAN